MTEEKICCHVENFLGEKHPCRHPRYKNHDHCIFHHPDVEEKEEDFREHLDRYMEQCENEKSIKRYNFREFIFPSIRFEKIFTKYADFRGSQFSGDADFRGSQFSGYADFHESQFSGNANFHESQFSGDANFHESQFSGDADFQKSQFYGYANFHESQFSGDAVFPESQFSGYANFINSQFYGDAVFHESQFYGYAIFQKSQFYGGAVFSVSQFSGDAVFSRSQFSGDANFRVSQFSRNAYFSGSQFSGDADFIKSQFYGNADFSGSQFYGDADFSESQFDKLISFSSSKLIGRADFENAQFKDEANFTDLEISFLKNLNPGETAKINLSRAILPETHFYQIDRIERHNFRDTFLLSISFADKQIIDCDFTGAVIDAIRTRGWKPDQATLDNTKYIYTDYTIETHTDESGKKVKEYKRIEDSRIPADGIFGEADNEDFTIADYLLEPFKWNMALSIPQRFRTASTNFFQFFSDFMHVTEGIDVEVRTKKEGNKLRLEFITDRKEHKQVIQNCFDQYLANSNKNAKEAMLSINFKNPEVSDTEVNIFKIQYEHQLSTLNLNLNYTKQLLDEKSKTNEALNKQVKLLEQFKESPQSIVAQQTPNSPVIGTLSITVDQNANPHIETNTNVSINLKVDLPAITTSFGDLFKELKGKDQEIDNDLKGIQTALNHVSGKSKEAELIVPMNKLQRFLIDLENEDSKLSKVIKGTKKGVEYAQKTAGVYNKFAQWLALPQVPDVFTK